MRIFQKLFSCKFNNPECKENSFGCKCGLIGTTAAIITGAAIAATGAVTAAAISSSATQKAAATAQQAAAQQAAAQKEIAQQQIEATQQTAEAARTQAKMTPQEEAYIAMMRERAQAGLGAPEFESTTAQETETALEALQKYYMQRGWQPSPRETGLLIEPSQKVARDIAIQNALLKRQAQQQAWERAYQLTPLQSRLIEQQSGISTLPSEVSGLTSGYQTQAQAVTTPTTLAQQLALQKMEQAQAQQMALGSMLAAYASPLLQQRLQTPSTSTIIPSQTYPSQSYQFAGGSYNPSVAYQNVKM